MALETKLNSAAWANEHILVLLAQNLSDPPIFPSATTIAESQVASC